MEQEETEKTEMRSLFPLSAQFPDGASHASAIRKAAGMIHDGIGAAIEVHKDQGPGLLESIYQWCLTMELQLRGHQVKNQDRVVIRYKQFRREEPRQE